MLKLRKFLQYAIVGSSPRVKAKQKYAIVTSVVLHCMTQGGDKIEVTEENKEDRHALSQWYAFAGRRFRELLDSFANFDAYFAGYLQVSRKKNKFELFSPPRNRRGGQHRFCCASGPFPFATGAAPPK